MIKHGPPRHKAMHTASPGKAVQHFDKATFPNRDTLNGKNK